MAATIESYTDVISKLGNYITRLSESTGEMDSAGKDCVDNMEGDPASTDSYEALKTSLGKINAVVEDIQKIMQEMEEELDEIIRAAEIAKSMDY